MNSVCSLTTYTHTHTHTHAHMQHSHMHAHTQHACTHTHKNTCSYHTHTHTHHNTHVHDANMALHTCPVYTLRCSDAYLIICMSFVLYVGTFVSPPSLCLWVVSASFRLLLIHTPPHTHTYTVHTHTHTHTNPLSHRKWTPTRDRGSN